MTRRPALPALRSVRARITVAATCVVAAALGLAALLLVQTLERTLTHNQDVTARARGRELAAILRTDSLPPRLVSIGDDAWMQVVSAAGTVVAATPKVADRPAVATFPAHGSRPVTQVVRRVPDGPDLESYRVTAMPVTIGAAPATAYIAYNVDLVGEPVTLLKRLLLVGIPVVVVLLGGLVWVVVGRALRPVEAIRAQVSDISDSGLDARVPVPRGRDEITDLAQTMNAMLDRLEAAGARQRAFAADASHELQAPLTSFRTELEVALATPGRGDWHQTAAGLLAASGEMEQLVRDLLFVAQQDHASAEHGPSGLVDLDDLVLEEAVRIRAQARCAVDTSAVSAAPVRGSADQLRRLVRNLVENAVRHAETRMRIELSSDNAYVVLTVADDGPGIPIADRARVFDRFVRLEGARDRDSGGTGLGLAIVAAVVSRHGGSVEVTGNGSGATFVVKLPCS